MDDKSNSFDAMRLLAAIAVLYSHSFPIFGLPEPMIFGDSVGKAAVGVFFVISGYLVCRSWEQDSNVGRFARRRGLRILPGLLVSVLVTTLVIGSLWSSLGWRLYLLDGATWASIRSNATLVSDIDAIPHLFDHGPTAIFNGSLWTLRYEVLMYLTLVVVAMTRHLKTAAPLIFVGSVVALAAGLAAGMTHLNVPLPLLWKTGLQFDGLRLARLGAYFFGAASLYLYRDRVPLRWPVAALLVAALCVAPDGAWTAGMVCVALPYTMLVAALRAPLILRRPLNADLSYGVYLYAYPVQQAVTDLARANGWSWAATLLLSSAVTGAVAWVSWTFVEKPALGFKPRRARAPTPVLPRQPEAATSGGARAP